MYVTQEGLRYSPSDLMVFLESEFASWLDRWDAERRYVSKNNSSILKPPSGRGIPKAVTFAPDDRDQESELFAKYGTAHEEAFLQQIKDQGTPVVEIVQHSDAEEKTIAAMQAGAPYIFQARLQNGQLAGWADFLVRTDGPSNLGDFHYEPLDTKLARSTKPSYVVQLSAYSDMLERKQERRPHTFSVALGNGETEQFRTDDFFYYYRELTQAFLNFHNHFDANSLPHPGLSKSFGRWSNVADEIFQSSDHLSTIAGIYRSQIRKLEKARITSTVKLVKSKVAHVPRLSPAMLVKLKKQAKLQLESRETKRPLYEVIEPSEDEPARGLAMLPPSAELDVFFDIEGFPLLEGGLEYLLGAAYIGEGECRFCDWWAHTAVQEKRAFEAFIDWAHARWKQNPGMHIYHYASYEVTAMRHLMGKYATREREVDDLLRNQVFVDLYKIVRQGLVIGTPSYSLKDVEKLYLKRADARQGEVTTAAGSIVAYQAWRDSGQSESWKESPILKDIRDYNEIDCRSTWQLVEWLRKVQRKHKISMFVEETSEQESVSETDDEPESEQSPAQELAEKLIAEVEQGKLPDEQDRKTQELLAWLLEYHWREAKPAFWSMFARHEMTEEELFDDLDCLAGLQRTKKPVEPIKRSRLLEYRFDPDQDSKLHAGSRCFFAHDLSQKATIDSFNPEKGLLEIKLGPKAETPPQRFNLIPDEHVSADIIAAGVQRYVEAWLKNGKQIQAIDDLLRRRRPRIKSHKQGMILRDDKEIVAGTVEVIGRMNGTTLCIQGPPGTGKTYVAAAAIVELLRAGKKIGVTATSHKAIMNVIQAVHERLSQANEQFDIYKVGGYSVEPLIESGAVYGLSTGSKVADVLSNQPVLIGGTAWVFSRSDLDGEFDYLFVDEAGQFSLANTVGVGLSAKNLVLVGDQMQLSQPTQATHPGDSGKSALEHLLGGHSTIPSDFGIFLNQTRRMHPDICSFISDAVYEGRLHAHENTTRQRIVVPKSSGALIDRKAGIIFVPVEHEDNTQASEEEVDVIESITKELMGRKVHQFDGGRPRKLNADDLLVVAPYNMQVRRLEERLSLSARVGTVDRFQGQEAHIVIISMCASSLEESKRGIDFLFDPNRINVAVSRARTLAIIVASPKLLSGRCQSIEDMKRVNLFCWLKAHAHTMDPATVQELVSYST